MGGWSGDGPAVVRVDGTELTRAPNTPQGPECENPTDRVPDDMAGIIVTLLIIWLVLAVLGAVLEGLFWLTVVAIVLMVATGIYGWMKRKTAGSS